MEKTSPANEEPAIVCVCIHWMLAMWHMDGVFFEENSNEFAKKFAVQCHDEAMKNLSPHSLTVSMLFIGIA